MLFDTLTSHKYKEMNIDKRLRADNAHEKGN